MQLLSATRQNSGEFIFHAARLPERSGHDSFHQYFTQGSIVTVLGAMGYLMTALLQISSRS